MQSSRPIPGNPWPHDLVLEVDDAPQAILDLLWLREACGLEPTGVDLPPLLEVPPTGSPVHAPDPERRRVWQAAWPIVWDEVLEHAGRPRQGERFQRLLELPVASPDRARLIREFIGPTWRDRFGDEVFDDDGYRDWIAADAERHLSRQLEYERSPEHVALPALIPAWEAGLVTVITIPTRGSFTRVVGPSALLVTAATRDDPDAYRAALETFVEDVPRS
ncbi:hypothetical protein [Amnibacterium kyonggiense]|uniref:Uncharacterized protein n=1 Tax=Amnibacterium kyonggiense TaxID=595671 RepID=A0A4R7FS08_9MICO|nr:hypothetical protein [Amnibacterium kyonggiense]TDS80556.1 hypothetical protein CLV52_1122 [Amnibacterium kyonggiense]